MKALICEKPGPPETLQIKETGKPAPGKGQVLIKTEACALNYPDTLIIEGLYQFKPPLPFSPGAEVSGTVVEVGEGVTHLKAGDRVAAGTTWGGLAEYVLAEAAFTFQLPDSINAETGAATLMTYGTGYHGLADKADLRPGQSLLVLGAAGGVGTAAIQIGKAMGATVIAAASTEEKLAWCKEQGADHLVNYETVTDLKATLKEITAGKGVDVIYDPVGGKFSEPAFRAIAIDGKHLVVGFTNGEIPRIPFNLPLLKSASIVGVFWGSFIRNNPQANRENVKQIFRLIQEGKLTPRISETFTLETAKEALLQLKERKALGKVVVKIS